MRALFLFRRYLERWLLCARDCDGQETLPRRKRNQRNVPHCRTCCLFVCLFVYVLSLKNELYVCMVLALCADHFACRKMNIHRFPTASQTSFATFSCSAGVATLRRFASALYPSFSPICKLTICFALR